MRSSLRSALAWVVCAAFLSGPLYCQEARADANGQAVLQANARTVVVDVVVLGKNGGPVTGLHLEDFEVNENGKPQKVTSFEEHGGVPPGDAVLPLRDASAKASSVVQNDPVTVLLFDGLNTQLQDQIYVRRQMLKYLADPLPGKRMAVFALGATLHFVQGFTDDPAVLAGVLKNIKSGAAPRSSPLLQSPLERTAVQRLDELDAMGGHASGIAGLQAFLAEQEAERQDTRLVITLDAFQQLARYLGRLPGRKNLVWFSSAFPVALFPNSGVGDPFARERDHDEIVRKTDAALAAAQVAIYPVAAEGLATDSINDAGAQQVVHSAYDAQVKQTQTLQGDALERNANHTAMDEIADDTGGRAFYNGNGLSEALTQVLDHGAHYYTLFYTPADAKMDGKFRKIRVKLARSGGKLAYRRGYYAAVASKRP